MRGLLSVRRAAVPVAAATGASLNAKQLRARNAAQASGVENREPKPILHITAGVIVLLLIGSVTYHTLTYLP